jgi:hypothetical protein
MAVQVFPSFAHANKRMSNIEQWISNDEVFLAHPELLKASRQHCLLGLGAIVSASQKHYEQKNDSQRSPELDF